MAYFLLFLFKIVKTIRSGKEGHYPALEHAFEAKLAELDPELRL